MSIDLVATLRRRKPEKRLSSLRPRPRSGDLTPADAPPGRVLLVPDTNIYISSAAGTLSSDTETLLDRSLLFHCSVCLSELATGIANSDPSHGLWAATRDHYAEVMSAIPGTRVIVPDQEVWLDAGILSGTLARTQRLQPHRRKEMLNDALILLTAARNGLPVLTSNRDDFDLLQQLAPECVVYHC